MRRHPLFLLILAVLCAHFSFAAAPAPLPDGLYAEFITPRGTATAELFYTKAPLMCVNFVGLAEGTLAPLNGKPFYTGLTWYRVVPGFVIQSGNPGLKDTDDDQEAHPHRFPDEFVPGLRHDTAGTLSMANAGPDTNSCEFFLTLRDTDRLDYLHSVFGRVVRGVEVLPLIKQDDPLTIKIIRVGAAAQAFKAGPAEFAARRAAAKKYADASGPAGHPTAQPGPAAHFDDPGHLLPQEPPRAQYFNYKLANFERVTGVRIVARLFQKSPPPEEDKVPGAYMRGLAKKFGTDRRGAFLAYFADEDDWRVWIGDESASAFLGRPATPADLGHEAALHDAKEAYFQAAAAQGDADFAQQQHAAPPDKQPPPAQHLKLHVDALLDRLIQKLEPKSSQ
ncbi:MAG: peptidylprolyl isomerase [Verrucomicrobia bacterium]|nr:peptidylprolyl isomerase [Verrucomicrobiota bacterium]